MIVFWILDCQFYKPIVVHYFPPPSHYFFLIKQGASLLLMLKTYLSEDVFQNAVVFYLHSHSYASIKSDDLWDSFNEVSDPDILFSS